ncbi:hypothetical protein [Vallitalea okinawensis]|uniref:hypothetical protein n=1 Tax=Vallitalea okinawensis TaxID=2078660 RepID=UPI000CFBE461|nr:hypothetical protein [Vallitalea okinawensis]
MSFWKDGFSIDESNKSMLIFGLFGCFITLWLTYYIKGFVDETFAEVLKTLAYCVAGVNGLNAIDHIVSKTTKTKG